MKKTIIITAAVVISAAGVLSSQVKVNATPTAPTVQAVNVTKVVSTDRKDLGSAD
jgi:hypothetical protein